MPYNLLADLIVVLHFLFIVFVLFGGMLCLVNGKWAWLHVPAVIWGAGIEFSGWICPLTPLENRLRYAGDGVPHEAGFIEHYLLPIIYPEGLTRNIQIVLGLLVLVFNLLVYSAVVIKRKKKQLMASK